MNYKRYLESMRSSRDSWLELLAKDPDSVVAAQFVLKLNSQIEFVKTQRLLAGDYDEV